MPLSNSEEASHYVPPEAPSSHVPLPSSHANAIITTPSRPPRSSHHSTRIPPQNPVAEQQADAPPLPRKVIGSTTRPAGPSHILVWRMVVSLFPFQAQRTSTCNLFVIVNYDSLCLMTFRFILIFYGGGEASFDFKYIS